MGLVSSLHLERGKASVELVLTSGWCPFAARVLGEVKEKLEALPEIRLAEVRVVWEQPWTMDRLSESARSKLRFLPDPARVPDRQGYIAGHLRGVRAPGRPQAVKEETA
jgi:metal-sulfur cluster biosynthetic enzyme